MTKSLSWDLMFDQSNMPLWDDISYYIENPLWDEINNYIKTIYLSEPVLSYSKCSAQRGWNIKYKKGQKALCTLYPMSGYFISLIVISNKEEMAVELILPSLCDYIQTLYKSTKSMPNMGHWLMINVTDKTILNDVKTLIELKVKPK